MSIISEKVSYLRGLAEGLKIDGSSSEGKLLSEIINVLGEIAEDIDYLEDSQDEVFDRVYDLEDEVYGEEDSDDYDDFFGDDGDDEQFTIKCPNCDDDFLVDADTLENDEDIVCPKCGEVIELEFGCDGCEDCE
ncbi:MAG: hypothetical protein LBH54_01375 [Clostridiales bacterium]|jgi:predicted Zn finger-like uncharacterized protein|nr:hypothetical protein [Clostridiales bacterium]